MIIYKGDTVIALTQKQMQGLNLLKLDKDRYKALSDTLTKQVAKYQITVYNAGDLANELSYQVKQCQELNDNGAKASGVKDAEIKQLILALKWEKVKSKVLGGTFGSTTAICLGALIIIEATKK